MVQDIINTQKSSPMNEGFSVIHQISAHFISVRDRDLYHLLITTAEP